MIEPLSLYPGSSPCVGSGYCCQRNPCPFGEVTSKDNPACKFLEPIEHEGNTARYACGIAEEIVKQPAWEVSPAFGAGCCSPMFNENRQRILAEIEQQND